MTKAPIELQELRRRIYVKAKAEPSWRFWGLYVHVCKMETLHAAYKLAKKNKIERLEPKPVIIHWLVVTRYEWPELDFEVACGRGTYIRSLIRDWGRALKTGGCLTSLRRLAVGPFTTDTAHTPEHIEAKPLAEVLIPLEEAREQISRARAQVPPRPP